jgi:hypothetical protein
MAAQQSHGEHPAGDLNRRLSGFSAERGGFRVALDSEPGRKSYERFGTASRPLPVYGDTGTFFGQAYKVLHGTECVGLLIETTAEGKAAGVPTGFVAGEWPLDDLAHKYSLLDLDNPLLEPDFQLVLDEDEYVVRVNHGTKELDLRRLKLDSKEEVRGSISRILK